MPSQNNKATAISNEQVSPLINKAGVSFDTVSQVGKLYWYYESGKKSLHLKVIQVN